MGMVNGISQNLYYMVNNDKSIINGDIDTPPITGASACGDVVDISTEAKNALKMDQALMRSEELMHVRGLDDGEISSFRNILAQYESSGADAKEFLKSLSSEQRDLVKRANSYGSDLTNSVIDSFSEEGAINMLQEQDYRFAVDLNGDDVVDKGAGKTFVFPPPSTPESVMDAWDSFSQTLSDGDILMFSAMFKPTILLPGAPDATTIKGYNLSQQGFPQNEAGWIDLLDRIYEGLEYNNKLSGDQEQIEYNEKLMRQLREFATYIQ